MDCKKYRIPSALPLAILLIFGMCGCVSVNQQVSDSQREKLNHHELHDLVTGKDEFDETLNPEVDQRDFPYLGTEAFESMMGRSFQSPYTIPGLGTLQAGRYLEPEIRNNFYPYDDEPLEIFQDNLLFTINYGGGGADTRLVDFQLIWNGEYYLTDNIPTVDLVFSFKDLNHEKANVYRYLRFDLTSLKLSNEQLLYIHFLGSDELIPYRY